jgi:hypothetical protein
MKKMLFLGFFIVFLPAMSFAQEKIEAPVWNVGDKWNFTGDGSVEVVKMDQSGYILKFSDKNCIFESQDCSAILFEKSTRNRINAVEADKRKKYVMGLSKSLNFPFSIGKQWKTGGYSGKVMMPSGQYHFHDYSEDFKVIGSDEIGVRAGKFKTLKVEYKRKLIGASSPSMAMIGEEIKHQYWYSPDVKYFVKCEYDKGWMKENKEIFNWELTSFQLRK